MAGGGHRWSRNGPAGVLGLAVCPRNIDIGYNSPCKCLIV